ncbi:unnamed protein product, partial [marine sediment metagenome]
VLGKPVTELWSTKEEALEAMEAVRTNRSWMGELVARRKDDSVFDVQLSGKYSGKRSRKGYVHDGFGNRYYRA